MESGGAKKLKMVQTTKESEMFLRCIMSQVIQMEKVRCLWYESHSRVVILIKLFWECKASQLKECLIPGLTSSSRIIVV